MPPPCRAGRCRRGRGRCCRRSSGAPDARDRPRRPGRPRGRRHRARRRRRRRSARASRREAARGAAARGAGATTGRGGAPAAARARAAAAASARPSPSAPAWPRRRWSRASCARAHHGCRGGASAWSDRSGRNRPPWRPGRSGGADRAAGASPRARVRQNVGRRKTSSSGNGTRASNCSFVGARGSNPEWSARALVVNEKAWHRLRTQGSNRSPRGSVRARTYDPANCTTGR